MRIGQTVRARLEDYTGEVTLLVGYKSGRKIAVVQNGDDARRFDVRDLDVVRKTDMRRKRSNGKS